MLKRRYNDWNPNKIMRIGYCTHTDPFNKGSWSGSHFSMMEALKKHHCEIVALGPIENLTLFFWKIYGRLIRLVLKRNISPLHTPSAAKEFSRRLQKKINRKKIDALFVPAGSELIAFLETDLPIVYLSDATAKSVIEYYPGYSNLSRRSENNFLEIEKRAIVKADKIIYASDWAAESAIEDFSCEKSKISIVPFGANVNVEDVDIVEGVRNSSYEKDSVCNLLFCGVDWDRKGGQIAYDVLIALNSSGLNAQLNIIGCNPPQGVEHEKMKVFGFLNKNNSGDNILLKKCYEQSDFFLMPTRAECAGIVFAEASAYGLPIISTSTGGISTYVENGKTGYLLSINAEIDEYVKVIVDLWSDKNKYADFSKSSRRKYEKELNWDSWGEKVSLILNELE